MEQNNPYEHFEHVPPMQSQQAAPTYSPTIQQTNPFRKTRLIIGAIILAVVVIVAACLLLFGRQKGIVGKWEIDFEAMYEIGSISKSEYDTLRETIQTPHGTSIMFEFTADGYVISTTSENSRTQTIKGPYNIRRNQIIINVSEIMTFDYSLEDNDQTLYLEEIKSDLTMVFKRK